MEQTAVVLISATITGIIGPILTLIIKNWINQLEYPTPAKERLKKLIRETWKGYFIQVDPSENNKILKTDININLSRKGRIIVGEGTFIALNQKPTTVVLKNGIFDGNILKIEYENKDRGVFQKGSIIFEMDDYGNKLAGIFAGYSPSLKKIISGEVLMNNY